jgi:hypothetical protein
MIEWRHHREAASRGFRFGALAALGITMTARPPSREAASATAWP